MKDKKELEILEIKYPLDMIMYEINLEECSKEIEYFKTEVNFIFCHSLTLN